MQAKELRELTEQELELRGRELQEDIFRLRLKRGTGQLEKPTALSAARRDVARIETIRRERVIAESRKQVG